MASTAVSKIRTSIKVSTGTTTAKNITGISKATSCVVTSTGHGLTVGTVVVFASVGGMTELNGVAAVITAITTDTFTLGGVDSSGYTTYTSGGTATPHTMTQVANALNWNRDGGEAETFDTTNLMSTVKEKSTGLKDPGSVSVPMHNDPTDPGMERIRKLSGTDTAVPVTVTRSDGKAFACMVKWTGESENYSDLNNIEYRGEITGPYSWYA